MVLAVHRSEVISLAIDIDYLRRHYSSLSDEALREIDRSELVAAAQKCYDEELARRAPAESKRAVDAAPDWLEEAACACTFALPPGTDSPPDAEEAREALQAAGIPCHLEVCEVDPPPAQREPRRECRLMVPGDLTLQVGCVLDKKIWNQEIESEWRAHFETLSDEDLRAVDSRIVLGGLLDRIERITRAYDEELARRGLEPSSDWRDGHEA
jgi:hypothetical protein